MMLLNVYADDKAPFLLVVGLTGEEVLMLLRRQPVLLKAENIAESARGALPPGCSIAVIHEKDDEELLAATRAAAASNDASLHVVHGRPRLTP